MTLIHRRLADFIFSLKWENGEIPSPNDKRPLNDAGDLYDISGDGPTPEIPKHHFPLDSQGKMDRYRQKSTPFILVILL